VCDNINATADTRLAALAAELAKLSVEDRKALAVLLTGGMVQGG